MADKLYVVNQALAWLGEEAEDNLDPTKTRNATRKVLRHAEQARDAVLERHPWLCALTYAQIAPSANLPAIWKYAYTFEMPDDFIRLFSVPDGAFSDTPGLTYFQPSISFATTAPWTLGSADKAGVAVKVVFSRSAGPLMLEYVRRLEWNALPPSLIDGISLELAARACQPVNGSVERAEALAKAAGAKLMIAQGIDGMQEGDQAPGLFDTFAAIRQTCL